MKVFWAVLAYSVLLALCQVLFKIGMNQFGKVTAERGKLFVLALLSNPYMLAGIVIGIIAILYWFVLLSWFDISIIYPLTFLSLIIIDLLSWGVLKEKITLNMAIGTLIISAGTYILLK
jgi:uncharacterized membrane protein